MGIHGRELPEAAGAQVEPFRFVYQGMEIVLPNAAALAQMKLAAARDKRRLALDPAASGERAREAGAQARKHAADVGRAVAMLTRAEREAIGRGWAQGRPPALAGQVSAAFHDLFGTDQAWARQVVASQWRREDLDLILQILADWFG